MDTLDKESADAPRAAPRSTLSAGRSQSLAKASADVIPLSTDALAIDCPSNLLAWIPEQPILRGDRHVFLRPFNKALEGGILDGIGRVRYGLLQLNRAGPLRALYSTAYVASGRAARVHRYLPGRLHVFLGDTSRMSLFGEDRPFMHCDHITIEPAGKEDSSLLNVHLTEMRPVGTRKKVTYTSTPLMPAQDESIDIGTLCVRTPSDLQPAGAVITRNLAGYRARPSEALVAIRSSLEPWHPIHTLPLELDWSTDHHLAVSFVLSKHAMQDRHYSHHQLVHESVIEGFRDDPGQPVRFEAVPFGDYFLIVILTISPGRPRQDVLWSMKRRQAK